MAEREAYDGPTDDDIRWCVAEHLSSHDFNAWLAAHDAKVRREAAREALGGLLETLAVNLEFLAFGARDEFRLAMELAETYRDDEYPEEGE